MKIRYLNENNEVMIEDYTDQLAQELTTNNTEYETGYICSDCGEFISEDSTTFVTNDKGYENPVCEDCISDSATYFYCDDCCTWYDYTVQDYTTEDDRIICEHCRYEDYYECDECGAIVHREDVYYCDDCDSYFCSSCWDEHYHEENLLYDYHDFNDWVPKQTEDEPQPQFYIGHELEIDEGNSMSEAVEQITTRLNGICMHDGSLSDAGIEFISHPLSYNYMLSLENEYRSVFTNLVNMGYRSHDTDTCGLHFHVTRPENSDIIDRIILFMETYKEEIIRLSRRKSSEISSWCNFLSDKRYNTDNKTIKSLDYIKKNKETSDRYMALNLTNSRTIEFRIFKGTLNYETFMADFEFVYNLTTLASDLSIPVEELTWTRVTSMGKFLPQYVNDHELITDKPIIDYTTEILIRKNREKEEIKKDLLILYKKVMKQIHSMTNLDNRKKNVKLINITKFEILSDWLTTIVGDRNRLDKCFEYDWDRDIETIKQRIAYIKERIDL